MNLVIEVGSDVTNVLVEVRFVPQFISVTLVSVTFMCTHYKYDFK